MTLDSLTLPAARLGTGFRAVMVDLVIIAAWAAVAGLVGLLLSESGRVPKSPFGRDCLAFVTLVLPTILTFAYLESYPRRGTPGKRVCGLVVTDRRGRPIGAVRSLVRSGVKFAPWQMGHTAVFQLIADDASEPYLVLAVLAQALVLVSLGLVAIDRKRRALHDLIAGTRVVTQAEAAPDRN